MDALIFEAMKKDPTERTSAKQMRDTLMHNFPQFQCVPLLSLYMGMRA